MIVLFTRVRGIDVAEHLRSRRLRQPSIAVDVQLCALLFALVAVENPQRNADAEPEILVDRRIAARRQTPNVGSVDPSAMASW